MQCNVSKKYSSQNFYSIFNFHSGRKFLYNSLDPNLTKKFQLFFLYSLNWVDFNFYHVQFEDIFLYLPTILHHKLLNFAVLWKGQGMTNVSKSTTVVSIAYVQGNFSLNFGKEDDLENGILF